ncbi:hypothetical protein HanLR1_Chr12g0446751 [Helianthus annuus]|nr:hypothetical protein HanHA89_Chr12g0469761 [Helianthus annuus]KAJ0675042.1 hypothetical protein HanLR1_Chr12g0446751 [Helianthus annuus]
MSSPATASSTIVIIIVLVWLSIGGSRYRAGDGYRSEVINQSVVVVVVLLFVSRRRKRNRAGERNKNGFEFMRF